MLVDWFTVGAQVLNFIVLVWLLKRYLYKPILDAIDAREARIADELASADATKAEANTERAEFEHKNEVFDQQRSALLVKATEEAKTERHRLMEEARQAAEAVAAKRREALRAEVLALSSEIDVRTRQEVFAVARKALKDLAATDLDPRMVHSFTQRMREIGDSEKATLGKAIKAASGSVLVRSAFNLGVDQRSALESEINEFFDTDTRIRFETTPELIGGIELMAGGQKLAWNIQDYLGSLEADVSALLGGRYKASCPATSEPAALKPEIKAD